MRQVPGSVCRCQGATARGRARTALLPAYVPALWRSLLLVGALLLGVLGAWSGYPALSRFLLPGEATMTAVGESVDVLAARVREHVAHIARGCRSGVSHNPAVHEQAIEADLTALVARAQSVQWGDISSLAAVEAERDALVARVTEAERERDELADSCARVTRAFEKEAARAADARNALERIAATARKPNGVISSEWYFRVQSEVELAAREVLARIDGSVGTCRCVYPDKCFCKPEAKARLDGSAEPCPYCGCPGRDFDGHVCEDYLAARLDGSQP